MEPKFPDVKVKLIGEDGNAFAIMGRVADALRRAGHREAVAEYRREAMSGDYSNLLRVTMATVSVGGNDDDEFDDDDEDW